MAGGHVWQGACMAGVCMAGSMLGHGVCGKEEGRAWQRGMHGREGCVQGGNACQERRSLQLALRILLERFLVFILLTSSY